MSRIVNDNFGPAGRTTTAVKANAKFTAVATATSSLSEVNVRHEGIDARNLADNYIVVKSIYADNDNSSEDFQYNMVGTYGGAFEVNHTGSSPSAGSGLLLDMSSSPMVLKNNDLLRIFHACVLTQDDGYGRVTQPATDYFMITFPVWDITSASLSNFETLPAHDSDLNNAATTQVDIDLEANKSGGIALYAMTGRNVVSGTDFLMRRNGMSVWHYKHGGADQTIYGIRINANGPYQYVQIGTSVRGWEQVTVSSTGITHVKMSHGHVGALQMRGGQP